MKTIIIYSTKYGCTEKAANILKAKMGGEVSLTNIGKEKVPQLDQFDNVILAGSIYVGKIQKKLTDYISKNLSDLLKRKVGLFICAGHPQTELRQKELEESFPAELFNHARAKEVFGYEINIERLGFLDKIMFRTVSGGAGSQFELSTEKIEKFAKDMGRLE